MIDPLHQHLNIVICEDAADAIAKGYDYVARNDAGESIKPIQIEKVVVVRKDTQAGNTTVDFILKDASGQQYVCMITGNLLKLIPC